MVRKYLEKTRQEFFEQKERISEQIKSCENKLKENDKFIELLENTSDPNYEAFTPRETTSNAFNRKKISELQEAQKAETESILKLQEQLGEINFKIDEITSVIRVMEQMDDFVPEEDIYDRKLAILRSVETERQRIARELHDFTTQNLTAIVHKTELCKKILDNDPVRCKLELFTIGKTLRNIIDDTREMIYDLRPMSFDDIGFDITVERTLDKFNSFHKVKCSYIVEGEPYQIDSVVQITLLRVIQEACNNALKHADASVLEVKLYYLGTKIILTITDDGKGFDIDKIPETSRDDNSGFGLSMMKERVYLLSGKIEIKSGLGNGCSIVVTIPKSKEDK